MPINALERQLNSAGYQYFESVAIRGIGIFETLKAACQLTIMKNIESLPVT
jgi:hypothetical protein